MKSLKSLLIYSVALLIGCSSCLPTLTKDSDDTNEVIYPWDTCSQSTGDHPCNFTLLDQNGNEVSLYDFYRQPIVLDLSAMWCPPCQAAAEEIQETSDKYSEYNLSYITILIETPVGTEPTSDDCKVWADQYGIIDPRVLAGSRDMIDYSSQTGWNLTSWPTFYFIDDKMKLVDEMIGYSEHLLDQKIQDLITD